VKIDFRADTSSLLVIYVNVIYNEYVTMSIYMKLYEAGGGL